MVLGKNFDWYNGDGVILQNKRGIKKTAYGLDTRHVVGWTSRFGSITFNQIGKEFPYGGVNEKGLAIEMLWYSDSYYEESGQPTISELEWVQFNLDNYKTAAEVEYYLDSMNINPIQANLHYLVADRGGRSFVVDFVNGKAVVSKTKEEHQVLTNSNYLGSLDYYNKNKENINFDSRSSADRFCQLTSKVNDKKPKSIDDVFHILQESSEERDNYKTFWTIVYDLPNLMIYFKTADNQNVKTISLKSLNHKANSPIYAMDINSRQIHWKKYNPEWNKKLLAKALEHSKIQLNLTQANQHMMQPSKFVMDSMYQIHHADLKVEFLVAKQKGLLFYTLMEGEENYKKFRGSVSAVTRANQKIVKRVHYSMPIANYALATFHDKNSNSKLDKFIGIPSEPTAFSNGAKATFGPPKFKKVVFNSKTKPIISVKIR